MKYEVVHPIEDCPHAASFCWTGSVEDAVTSLAQHCVKCNAEYELWHCLAPECNVVACGRGLAAHMVEHNKEARAHNLVISLADLSFWCYGCNSYVTSPSLQPPFAAFHVAKFGEEPPPLHEPSLLLHIAGPSS
eukprot:Opistho-2@26589